LGNKKKDTLWMNKNMMKKCVWQFDVQRFFNFSQKIPERISYLILVSHFNFSQKIPEPISYLILVSQG